MTTTESFAIYELLNRYFKSESDARTFVQEIEKTVNKKFESEKSVLSTKDDINRLELKIADLIANQERRFNNMIMWMIGTGVGFTGIIITVFKLITGK